MVRRALTGDADSIAGIIVDAWQTAYAGIVDAEYSASLNREKYSGVFTSIIRENKQTVFVFEKNNTVFGVVSGKKEAGKYDSQVVGLYVHPEEQGSGIGSSLLEEMKKHFESENCKTMIIWTLLGAKNNSFYKKHDGILRESKEIRLGEKAYPGVGFAFDLLQ
ncbi:MAG: GNAT family N-acetyltransferase [Candidatus Sabulitectum sp.]|nr:GNAT family N-acetyltransferase [Candidatus Sabulitectum sp.]